jgi:hypothetical protein
MRITSDSNPKVEIVGGLLDSGASGNFIDPGYAQDIHAEKKNLKKPIKVYNVDGTPNKQGTITQYVELDVEIHKRKQRHRFYITGLGNHLVILGFTWLERMNPIIDWKKGTLKWRISTSKTQPKKSMTEWNTFINNLLNEPKKTQLKQTKQPVTMFVEEDEEEHLNRTRYPLNEENDKLGRLISSITENNDVWINAKGTKATEIQAEINKKKETISVEDHVPKEFHKFLDVFDEEKAARFPEP